MPGKKPKIYHLKKPQRDQNSVSDFAGRNEATSHGEEYFEDRKESILLAPARIFGLFEFR